ncbi:MAG: pro-sigmaK processing inhibitor BofA family protein [Lachnospiraceae bacterium]|nr:pro-sigmaK processing inhibitor BofA family protein [Lachnospiraceae bacterium]
MNQFWILGIGSLILLICALRFNAEWLLNVVMRSVLGTIVIYFVNDALASVGIVSGVGINVVTVLTSGILGFPGLLALYGIGFYKLL